MLQGPVAELMFGDMCVEIPTYVRNDNADALYQVDSANTVANEKRLDGLLERNREEIDQNSWFCVGFTPGDMDPSDGLTIKLSSANIQDLLARNSTRIVTEGKAGN